MLADEFAARCRRGESPSPAEYAALHPEHARQIEDLFPAVALMEQLRMQEHARHESAQNAAIRTPPQQVGDFRMVREIGRGGMGVVYEAEQCSLRRRVAVKILPGHVPLPAQRLKRFQREAQTAARLLHTNIVPVFGVGQQEELHYYVMPLIRAVGLDEVIRALRRDPEKRAAGIRTLAAALIEAKFGTQSERDRGTEAQGDTGTEPHRHTGAGRGERSEPQRTTRWSDVAAVGLQAAEALDYAHRQGTLHRDVKPSNLLLDGEGMLCVADFGLASAVDQADAGRSGEVVGTPRYMAPEQLAGRADIRSDVYCLGATLYELLTLRAVADCGEMPGGASDRQSAREPLRPRKIDPAVPPDLETILLKCLAYDPSKRYPSAAELAADLRRFLEDKPIHARRTSGLERAWRWCRRNPALAGVSTVAVLLLIAVATTVTGGYLHVRKAYTETARALDRAEATSQVSLDVLDAIYRQLSPERVWIASDSGTGAEPCRCVALAGGLHMPVPPSEETAALLASLLDIYDRLAEQGGHDFHLMLESAIAARRVGDIQQRLGRLHEAETQYARAIRQLDTLRQRPEANVRIPTELAHTYNEIGAVRAAKLELKEAYQSHQQASALLRAMEQAGPLPEACRYELARTLYFLSNLGLSPNDQGTTGRPRVERETFVVQQSARRLRSSAVAILEELARERPDIADYRFLLALCYRPSAVAYNPAGNSGRLRAIQILENLKEHYPAVADYRYELMATYAWVPVALFPWQGRFPLSAVAEEGLRKALEESEWLVARHPAVPQYACSRALLLAKLGMACWGRQRLTEAEHFFQKALETQEKVTTEFPGLPSRNRVLVQFMRLRLGQICRERGRPENDRDTLDRACQTLQACNEDLGKLTASPDLAEDRLAESLLPVAREAMRDALAACKGDKPAETAEQ